MIILHKPLVETDGKTATISVQFFIEDKTEKLWYSVPSKYQNFLVTERLDAFVVGILHRALKTGRDIVLKAPISARLLYSLNHYVIDALCLANSNLNKIQIISDTVDDTNLNIEKGAGMGLSCGVDSFATFYDHKNEKGSYQVSYFTFFNAGSHGDYGGAHTRTVFYKRFQEIKRFANLVGLEVIPVDSNISEILKVNFLETHTLRNISCVLILQKLFTTYYYASPHRFDYYKLVDAVSGDYDILLLGLLSTESLNLFSSSTQFTRMQRLEFISKFPETYKHLNVCTNPLPQRSVINCSHCNKCMRTAVSLELLNLLDLYSSVFDLNVYKKNRNRFIGSLLVKVEKNKFEEEILFSLKKFKKLKAVFYFHSVMCFIKKINKASRKELKKYFDK